MIKKILLGISVLVIIGIGTGLYLWYKPAPKPQDAGHVFTFTADSLSKLFIADEKIASARYIGNDKALQVSGAIDAVSKNQDGGVVITLETSDPMNEVQCTMADSTTKVTKGQNITVLGYCKGNNMGVILTDCVVK